MGGSPVRVKANRPLEHRARVRIGVLVVAGEVLHPAQQALVGRELGDRLEPRPLSTSRLDAPGERGRDRRYYLVLYRKGAFGRAVVVFRP